MEAKTLLKLIKNDIAHLEEITGEFILEPLPLPDEVEVALVRAKALLRELELLYKFAVQHENNYKAIRPIEEPKVEASERISSEQLPLELFDIETCDDEQVTDMLQDQEHQPPTDEVQDIELPDVNSQGIDELSLISIKDSPVEGHFIPLIEPVESEIIEPENPILNEEEVEELTIALVEPDESVDIQQVKTIDNEEEVEEHVALSVEFAESELIEPQSTIAVEEEVEEHTTTLVEPAELDDISFESPIVNNEEVEEHIPALVEPAESEILEPESPIANGKIDDESFAAMDESVKSGESIPNEAIENSEEAIVDQGIPVVEETNSGEALIVSVIPERKEEVLAEEFKEVKKTLNETLGETHQMVNDILSPEKSESGYQITPINSIWDGIGINDRFLFIRELFANSSAKFETTVNTLDKLVTIQDAVNYLKMNFKWNKTEASHKFLDLVKRRFTK